MAYMLVRLEVAYGRVGEFSEIMSHLVPILESKGWRLHGAFVNRIGRLNRCYDLWEMPDANAVQSVLELTRLINIQRAYENAMQIVGEDHGLTKQAIERLGRNG